MAVAVVDVVETGGAQERAVGDALDCPVQLARRGRGHPIACLLQGVGRLRPLRQAGHHARLGEDFGNRRGIVQAQGPQPHQPAGDVHV